MSNVSFGGNWAEELVEAEALRDILLNLEWAVENCKDQDTNTEAIHETLCFIAQTVDKGPMLTERWNRGHSILIPELRHEHFKKCLQMIIDQMGL